MKLAKRSVMAVVLTAILTLAAGAADRGGWFVFAGPALADLSIPVTSGDKGYRLGFVAGAGYEVPLNGAFSLLVQAAFSNGGAHVDLSETSDMTYAGNAVVIPILLRIKPGRGLAPFLTVGGFAGWMFSPRLETDSGGSSSEVPISADEARPFLYGLEAGLGFEFKLGKAMTFVEAVYSQGLSNLAKTGIRKVRPSALNLLVGFRF